MGSGQSVRSSHFSRPPATPREPEIESGDHHISISNKMVERLVEDATIAGGAAAATKMPPKPRGDYKDKIFMERIRCLDESHSEKYKITVDDLNALARRIEMRTANMVSVEPICADYTQRVIDCYNERDGESAEDTVKCWETIVDDLNALARRIEMRTANMANMVSVEPICADFTQRVIDCYSERDGESSEDTVKCWETTGAFSKCVQEAASARLRARTLKDAREMARRERHVAHAREQAVLLGPAPHAADI